MEDLNLLTNENSIEEFLLTLSDDILLINIEEQIKESHNEKENYFEFIIDKMEAFKVIVKDNGEAVNKINDIVENICDKVEKLLEERFGITCDFSAYSNRSTCLKEIYRFFVIRKRIILENYIKNYINKEMKSLVLVYGKNKISKKDVTYNNNKKTLDKKDMIILMNIHHIIDRIDIGTLEDFVELLLDDTEEYTNNFIKDLIDEYEVTFTEKFIPIIKEEINKEKNTLIMNIRLSIIG